ncbi:anhydro-N-acetylmuramic acid kinase [Limibacter armeniacum]|uniref:anhydro-N-acetylmuramic acid kinase n=1 Tax=Limibacter armeniacum TaxID=466084 RepID=UPI002FE574F4
MENKLYKVIGLMSGTSLDGLDLAYCEFRFENGKWHYKMPFTETIEYDIRWRKNLESVEAQSALAYALLDMNLGRYIGNQIKEFIARHHLTVDFVSSHGHTIFHQPDIGLTAQIGSGAAIAAACGLPVINDFRAADVALGGQGAPLVPAGDRLLFEEFDFCLNLGGIANVSYEEEGKMAAFDICPANMPLNHFMRERLDKEYDENGEVARSGKVNQELFEAFNKLPFFSQEGPKSLGKEWVFEQMIVKLHHLPAVEDILATSIEHTAYQIGQHMNPIAEKRGGAKMLCTGGGAFNTFLMERIRAHANGIEVVVPDEQTVSFKEALIFAFLGVLRLESEANCLSSVTGARIDNCGGAIHHPFPAKGNEHPSSDSDVDAEGYSPLDSGSFNRLIGCGG